MLNIPDSASPIVSKEVHVLCPLKHGLEKGLNSPSPAVVSARFLLIGTRVPKRQSFQTAVGPLTLQDIGHVLPGLYIHEAHLNRQTFVNLLDLLMTL